jgi:hypothetical protein
MYDIKRGFEPLREHSQTLRREALALAVALPDTLWRGTWVCLLPPP